jgi:hypothetical protein
MGDHYVINLRAVATTRPNHAQPVLCLRIDLYDNVRIAPSIAHGVAHPKR